MRKKYLKKIIWLVIIVTISISCLAAVSVSWADDDEEDEWEDRSEQEYSRDESIQVPATVEVEENKTVTLPSATSIVPTVTTTSNSVVSSSVDAIQNKEAPVYSPPKDADADGIADNADLYPGKDDFSFRLLDINKNGLADDLENLIN